MINSDLSNQLSRVVTKLLSEARPVRCDPRVQSSYRSVPLIVCPRRKHHYDDFDGQHEQLEIVNLQPASGVTPNTSSRQILNLI